MPDEDKSTFKSILDWIKTNPQLSAAIFTVLIGPSMLGAGTSAKEAWDSWVVAGVPWGKSSTALEQAQLWEENAVCFKSTDFNTPVKKEDVEVSTLVCPSGDVLISVKPGESATPTFKWIAWDTAVSGLSIKFDFNMIESAYAGESDEVIKTRDNGDGTCTVMVINKYTGDVIRTYVTECG